jgi:hypothetical protein
MSGPPFTGLADYAWSAGDQKNRPDRQIPVAGSLLHSKYIVPMAIDAWIYERANLTASDVLGD